VTQAGTCLYRPASQLWLPSPNPMSSGWGVGLAGSSLSACASPGRREMFGLPSDNEQAKAAWWGVARPSDATRSFHHNDPAGLPFDNQLMARERISLAV
jgi:hypothetical protein